VCQAFGVGDVHATALWHGGRTLGYRTANVPDLERRLSYPPPPSDPPPFDPTLTYPPTASFPAYEHVGTEGPPGPHGPPAPRPSNVPLVAVIMAVTLLLCGGTAFAGVLVARYVTDRATEAVKPITELPAVPTALPTLPTDLPTELPTEIPGLPGLPTDPGGEPSGPDGKTFRVRYEVTGDGPVDITYIEKLGKTPKRIKKAKLPWRKEVSMTGTTLASVVAFRIDASEGSIACRAKVDDKEVAERDATGSFAVVTCSKLILR
jgi:hypothetical protein